ncbi:MAG TPA: PPC domain-containing protein [Gemmataceae bacterium]|nr:PPC domain-containing protein [Gemmataceae bacterium]
MITHATPVAVQRGQTAEVTVEGQMNFHGVYQALFTGGGITAEVIGPPPKDVPPAKRPVVRSVKLKVTVAADARPGVRDFRLVSTLGVSSIGQLLVVDDPVVPEKGDNNIAAKANPIQAPCVVHGRIEAAEDVDFFKFHADAGQTFTFEVVCARIEDRIHDLQKHADPMLTLFDAEGRELAANDDFYFADPMLRFTFPKAGDYFIQVRDSKYDGDPRWVYALLVTNKPYVSHVYPMAGNPGQVVEVEPVGSASLVKPRVPLRAPAEAGIRQVRLDVGGTSTNPTAFIVSPLPQVLEQEPNDAPGKANRVSIPCGINGRIGAKRDLDHFVFAAQKGKAIRFEVKARRFGTALQSSLDSVLEVMTPAGKVLASNDDLVGKDAGLVFTPPADGDYVLRVRDLNSKGGETFVYFIEADFARPDFTLRCDPDKAMIGPGSATAWYVHVARQNGFDGPVRVEVKGLPRGVTVNPLTIPATMTQGLLVLAAAADAPRGAANVQVVGTGVVKAAGHQPAAPATDHKGETLVRTATPNEEIYLPGGGRGRFDVSLQTVAVTEPSDILKVAVSTQKVTLKPGGEARIEVTVHRRPDYDKSVSLDVLLQHLGGVHGNPLPPGVTVDTSKSKTLLGTGSKGHVVLKAAPNAAPIEDVPISVLCHVSINFVVKVSYSSAPILVSVQK